MHNSAFTGQEDKHGEDDKPDPEYPGGRGHRQETTGIPTLNNKNYSLS